jgi:hypothetical protein
LIFIIPLARYLELLDFNGPPWIIISVAKMRKWLEGNPESSSNDDPIVFDTSMIPWWAWMKRILLIFNIFSNFVPELMERD